MAIIYILAGLNHFRVPRMYRAIVPPALPRPGALVALSGLAEIAVGVFLLWPRTRVAAAWALIALLVAIFPANLYMVRARDSAFKRIPAWILWARLPLQGLLIYWAYVYTLTSP